MTKKYIVAIFLTISSLYSQNKILFSVSPGLSLYNSENAMKVTGNHKVDWLFGVGVGLQGAKLLEENIYLEYNLTYRKVKRAIELPQFDQMSPTLIGTYGADLTLSLHNFDFGVIQKVNETLRLNYGPTLSVVNRSFYTEASPTFEDRLASLCVGLNCSIDLISPPSDNQEGHFFYSNVKIRYIHSLLFDARGRNLDNYYQSFLFAQLNIGLGYNL